MSQIRTAYLTAAYSTVGLLRDQAVAACWTTPSALDGFTVAGLAGHLSHQVFHVADMLEATPPAAEPISLLEHYARSAWLGAGVHDEANVTIRRSGDDTAAVGATGLADRAAVAVAGLAETLPRTPADRVVHLPWGPWPLALDDFLVTRMMEILVHSDDLAVSIGVDTPAVPDPVLDPVLELLTRLAARRHGAPAVLRALTRAERAFATITAL